MTLIAGVPVSDEMFTRLETYPADKWVWVRDVFTKRMNEAGYCLSPCFYIGPGKDAPFTSFDMKPAPLIVVGGAACMLHKKLPTRVPECPRCDSDVAYAHLRWAVTLMLADIMVGAMN